MGGVCEQRTGGPFEQDRRSTGSQEIMKKISVFLADESSMLRDGLRAIIDANSDMAVVGEAADSASAIAQVAELDPDVVVMDVSMPRLDGVKTTKQLKAANPRRKILALTAY